MSKAVVILVIFIVLCGVGCSKKQPVRYENADTGVRYGENGTTEAEQDAGWFDVDVDDLLNAIIQSDILTK